MKTFNKLLKSILVSLLLFVAATVPVMAGFGVSPSQIYNKNLLPGSQLEKTIIISRSDPSQVLRASVSVDSDQNIEDWFSFGPGQELLLPAGEQRVPLTIIVNVPEDAPLGSYEGYLRIRAVPEGEQKSGITVVEGARVDLGLVLTEVTVSDFVVRLLKLEDTKEGEPLQLLIKAENIGNSTAALSEAQLDIYNLSDELVESLSDRDLDAIEAFKTGEIYAEFSHQLSEGEYYAQARVYNNGDVLREEKLYFRVMEGTPREERVGLLERIGGGSSGATGVPLSAIFFSAIAGLAGVGYLVTKIVKNTAHEAVDSMVWLQQVSQFLSFIFVISLFSNFTHLMWIYNPQLYFCVRVNEKEIGAGCSKIVEDSEKQESEVPEEEEKADLEESSDGEEAAEDAESREVSESETEGVVAGKETTRDIDSQLNVLPDPREKEYLVYSRPDRDSTVLYEAVEGEKFEVLDSLKDWYKVRVPSGLVGWLSKAYVKE